MSKAAKTIVESVYSFICFFHFVFLHPTGPDSDLGRKLSVCVCCYSRAGVTFNSALKSVHGPSTDNRCSHLNRIICTGKSSFRNDRLRFALISCFADGAMSGRVIIATAFPATLLVSEIGRLSTTFMVVCLIVTLS